MAMLIVWHTLIKLAILRDGRPTDALLIVKPGITIHNRPRMHLPNDPGDYYRRRDVVTSELRSTLPQARTIITNFHAVLLRE